MNVFWNDPSKPIHKNSSRTMTVVFTGQGSTELAEKWESRWVDVFQLLVAYGGVNFTRLDLALDDYDGRWTSTKSSKSWEMDTIGLPGRLTT